MRLLLTLVLCVFSSVAGALEPHVVYVSPHGDDTHPGTQEQPVKSPSAAQALARAAVAENAGRDVSVVFLGGRYFLEEPLHFTAADAAGGAKVTYEPAPGAAVLLSGGRVLEGEWKPLEEDRWQLQLPEGERGHLKFRQLFADGMRLPRGRFPEASELLHVTEVSEDVTGITLDRAPGVTAADAPDLELVVLQNWSITRARVSGVEGARITTATPAGWIGHGDMTTTSMGKPAFLQNALAFVDEPGEWYLDVATGTVTYQAMPGEDPNTKEFIAPRLEQLLVVEGTPEQPVRNLHFRGLAFAHAEWPLPEFGFAGIQAGHFGPSTKEPVHVLPVAVEFTHATNCTLENVALRHTGASGIGFGAGTSSVSLTHSRIEDIGGCGVMSGWRGKHGLDGQPGDPGLAGDWPDAGNVPQGNRIEHNTVTRCGAVDFGSVGIYDAFSDSTRIVQNHVFDLPYTGISVGFRWDQTPTSQRRALVQRNHVHDVMQMLADGGCIYTLGLQPETILRGNLLHGVPRSAYAHGGAPNNGIFFDEGTKGLIVDENVIYDTSGEPIRFNETGPENLIWRANHFGVAPEQEKFPHALAAAAGPQPKRREKSTGFALNEDDSHFYLSRTAEEMTVAGLHAFVDQYAGTHATQLFLNPNAMRTSFRSAVWDNIWELGNQVMPTEPVAVRWIENARLLDQRGLDAYAVWLARAAEKGIEGWISMRMNDIHNVDDPTMYLHSQFWVEHPEYWRVPNAPSGFFERALDYAHPAVREHHMQLIREYFERYDMHGLELDWMRFGWHFAPGQEEAGRGILTQFMREVRALADEWSAKRGHPIQLAARVPATPEAARGLGMDGVTWAREGLVDYLTPSPFWATSDFDIPMERWREEIGQAAEGVTLATGAEILMGAYPGAKQTLTDLEAVYGLAAGALHRGADTVYLFNYMDKAPMADGAEAYQTLLRDGLGLDVVTTRPRRHVATYRDTVPTGTSSEAQLPSMTAPGVPLRLYIGPKPQAGAAVLLIGLAASETAVAAVLEATANDAACTSMPDHENSAYFPSVARAVQFAVPVESLVEGYNTFIIRAAKAAPAETVVWAQLRIEPTN